MGFLLAVWGVAIAAGCLGLAGLREPAGRQAGPTPSDWPRDSVIPLDGRRPTLLMFLHPLCPCSRASVEELAELDRSHAAIGFLCMPWCFARIP